VFVGLPWLGWCAARTVDSSREGLLARWSQWENTPHASDSTPYNFGTAREQDFWESGGGHDNGRR
jgi:hypothetical protein